MQSFRGVPFFLEVRLKEVLPTDGTEGRFYFKCFNKKIDRSRNSDGKIACNRRMSKD